ncbi:LytTR family transcriptional regulator DNA-binding domain-containing protein [Maribellus maritimus]|uniref:LytTR family transcriptional regulator DNA-binding domain-containing protein n=1 Tax=Maribellus maritimus TaxID=2870838 RepID=UPI001EEB461D|nr:LytTR family transcriptional regulator DNA-binding domain-containing protein [Maribellus maritimus]MCG6188681.1 LytTR family transcriptional regulator DNA-binding domain-containing protein [Maribellus maritimus]
MNANRMQMHESKLILSTPNYFHIVELDDIIICETTTDMKTTVCLKGGQKLCVDIPLKVIRNKIERADFFQPQDNCLVNGQYVSKVQCIQELEILLVNGQRVLVSPERKEEVRHFLKKVTRIQI